MDKQISALTVLESMNKSFYNRPSVKKKRILRKKSKQQVMKEVSDIFSKKDTSNVCISSQYSEQMAAIILTRWSKKC